MDEDERSRITVRDLRRALLPLRFVFWGALVVLIDVRVNRVDLLHDTAGMTLVCLGAWTLASLRVDPAYRRGMLLASVVALLSLLGTVLELATPSAFARGYAEAVGLLEVAALAVFCAMMVRLSRAAELPDVAADWTRTLKWFLWVYAGLLGLIRAVAALSLLAGRLVVPVPTMHASAWFAIVILFFGLLLVPWIRLFLSTNRLSNGLRLKAWRRSLKPSSPRTPGAAT